ncbi:MAG: hypothetical protein F4137_08870 [Acidobacteria bacterium]|nr:hypothetical protein [Acidobacteriota bacterium]MYH28952.1 hypothetical protein [Acidobacteriota bacterium]
MLRKLSGWISAAAILSAGAPASAQTEAETFRYPPNFSAELCLFDFDAFSATSVPLPLNSLAVELDGTDTVIVTLEVANHCATAVRVSGLVPPMQLGEVIQADAQIEVAAISRDADDASNYVVSGTGTLAAFDVPANGEVTHEVIIRLTSGTSDDVITATASSLGFVLLDGTLVITGVGYRAVCVHYTDRPCGAFQ